MGKTEISEKTIRIKLVENRQLGLFVAVTQNLEGLYVSGRSEDEVAGRLPQVLRMLLEARGRVVSLAQIDEPGLASFQVKIPNYKATLADYT